MSHVPPTGSDPVPGDQSGASPEPIPVSPPETPATPSAPAETAVPTAPPLGAAEPPAPEAPASPAVPVEPAPAASTPPPPPTPSAPAAPIPPPPPAPEAPQQPAAGAPDPLSNIQVNYWLSVFFTWIPALIFYVIEKDKGQSLARNYHVANLNFSLLRTMVSVAIWVVGFLPYIGWLLALVLWIGAAVLFVFHIIAAVKVSERYRAGQEPEFIFNAPLVK